MAKKNNASLADHQKEHELMGLNKYSKGLVPSFESLNEVGDPVDFGVNLFRIGNKLYASDGVAFKEYVTAFDQVIPVVPTNLVATPISLSRIDLTWAIDDTVPGVAGYNVYRNGALVGSVTTLSFSDIALNAATLYTYTVSAVDYKGNVFAQSTAVGATTLASDVTAPTIPLNLIATAVSSSGIDLSWDVSFDAEGVTVYKIYRGGAFIGSSTTTTFSAIGLTAATLYSFTVSAVDGAGNESAQSGSVSDTTLSVDVTAPSIPTGLAATVVGPTSISLVWDMSTDAVGVVGYKVYRDAVQIAVSPTTVFTDTGLEASTLYEYTVTAIDAADNESAASASDSATTSSGEDIIAPTVPANLAATTGSSQKIEFIFGLGTPITSVGDGEATQVNLSWDASTDAVGVVGYKIYRDNLQIATTAGFTYADTGRTEATTYSYTVSAYDGSGNTSARSAIVTITTPSLADRTAPTVPTNFLAQAVSTSQIDLSWDASFDAVGVAGYHVFRQISSSVKIGFVGASMTMGAINGAQTLGSTKFWTGITGYGGGGPYQWAQNLTNSNSLWNIFNNTLNAQPTTTFWLELCAIDSSKANETYANTLTIVNEIKRRVPGAIIYVGAQPDYTGAHECSIAGTGGQARMVSLASQLVANGHCLAGPIQGPLAYPSETVADGCHPNTAGEAVLGQQVIDFFDAITLDYEEIATSVLPSYSDTGLGANTLYSYKVSAFDAAGNISAQSSVSSATTTTVATNRPIGIYSIDTVSTKSYIDGLLYRTGWGKMETSQGVYNFSTITTKLNSLPAGQKLTLVIFAVAGSFNDVPAYVMTSANNSGETWSNGQYGTNPLPWNAFALARWDAFCAALAAFQVDGIPLATHPKLGQIDCSIIGSQGIRLQIKPASYTAQLYKDACITAVTSMASRFPTKNCYVGLFGIGNDTTGFNEAVAIRDQLLATFNGVGKARINFYQETMTGKVPEITSNQGRLVYDVRNQTSIMLQACWPWSTQSTGQQCLWATADTPQKGFDNAALFGDVFGVTYVEMYTADINNAAYQTTFQTWHDALPAH